MAKIDPEMREFTLEELRIIADVEHKMDTGEIKFVVLDGQRMCIDDDTLTHFGLVAGQTVSWPLMTAIIKHKIAECERRIAEEAAPKH